MPVQAVLATAITRFFFQGGIADCGIFLEGNFSQYVEKETCPGGEVVGTRREGERDTGTVGGSERYKEKGIRQTRRGKGRTIPKVCAGCTFD